MLSILFFPKSYFSLVCYYYIGSDVTFRPTWSNVHQSGSISDENFFRASSWSAADLIQYWFEKILMHPLYKVNGLTILIGDGMTQTKGDVLIPGIKKLFHESENSSKPKYING